MSILKFLVITSAVLCEARSCRNPDADMFYSPAILTYAQRLVFIGGLLGLLCAVNYFLGAAAFHDLNSCVDCYETELPPARSTKVTSTDTGLAFGGFFYPPLLLPPFTWLVFEGKARMRKASIYVCVLLNILQRLVFYLEHSGAINHVRLGSRCYLWAYLSCIHILTFSMVCPALKSLSTPSRPHYADTSLFV